MLTALLVVLFSILIVKAWLENQRNKKKVQGINDIAPPGPKGVLGSVKILSQVGKIPFLDFHKISQKYGSILNLDLNTKNILILSQYENIKEVHSNCLADNRAPIEIPNLIFTGSKESKGVLLNSGSAWQELRRFTIRSLKDLGINKSASEETVLTESNALVEEIRRQMKSKNVVDVDLMFNKAVLNVVWKFVSNQRYEYDDVKLEKLMRVLNTFMNIGQKIMGKPIGIFPILRFFPPFRWVFLECYNGVKELRDMIQESIDEHIKTFDKNDPKDFIDMFLSELNTTDKMTIDQLLICCTDLFIAGSETSSKGLMFAMALMIRHPDVQTKVQEELDSTLQGKTFVSMSDKKNLPYTEAVINEVLRFCNVVPVVAPRSNTDDIKIDKYTVKKNTTIMTNTYSVHMDEDYWKDPNVFRPERFIKNGQYVHDERNIPFGIGRRRCLGEGLARMENFLFFSNLLLNFRFYPDKEMPSIDPVPGFSNGPAAFCTRVEERF